MATLEMELIQWLNNNATLVPHIAGRVFPFMTRRQGTQVPALTVLRVGTERLRSMQGASGLTFARIQINVLAKDYKQGRIIADLLRDEMDDMNGTIGTVIVQHAALESDSDGFDPVTDTHSVSTDWEIVYEEPKPNYAA